MSKDLTGITARMWLLMLKEGGRWSAGDLARKMELDPATLRNNVKGMRSTVHRYGESGHGVRFGVTLECEVPRGVTLGDVLACDLQRTDKA